MKPAASQEGDLFHNSRQKGKRPKEYKLTVIGGDRYPSLEAAQAALLEPLAEALAVATSERLASGRLVVAVVARLVLPFDHRRWDPGPCPGGPVGARPSRSRRQADPALLSLLEQQRQERAELWWAIAHLDQRREPGPGAEVVICDYGGQRRGPSN